MIRFGREICTNLEAAASREWLETNGIGGYSSGTIAGINTRRYHGLLVAATTPPTGRAVLLSKFEETLIVDGKRLNLSANQYPNAIYPEGYKFLKEFRLAPFPVWIYEIEGVRIEKTVFMPDGENTVICDYKFKVQDSKFKVDFELMPLLAFRDYHHLQKNEESFETDLSENGNFLSIQPYAELPRLYFVYENGAVEKTGFWYRNFEYERERERGFDFRENLYQPFALKFEIEDEKIVSVTTSTKRKEADAERLKEAEIERCANLIEISGCRDEFSQQLVLAADQFIVARGEEKSVIAGYPWFSDWGRDTMIALPGLTLSANRPEIARSIILEFSRHISQGMLPNRFPDVGEEPDYNTVDATLWYFEAIRSFIEKTGDYDFVRENLYEKLSDIIAWHLRGTRFNIHIDTDGLLYAGDEMTQLTWMDAKSGETVFTPRFGKAVEIQALWYNALRVMENLAARFEDEAERAQYAAMADLAELSFNQSFWNESEECLFDCIANGARDASVRPNQIFAVSLKNALLAGERARKVVRKVESELLTPVGLRSLSPKDSNYRPRYEGDGFERDSAYHQGTVWGWLAGAFWTAHAKVFPDEQGKFQDWLENFKAHLSEAGIGQISEIFDADAPHPPRGCIAQAWSVAEILRIAKSEE
ncbi:MAG: amylo-alpha-1,6-glucosidase [Acidobacteriota bacterium]|nr:amylo-alpha-1,6-glucosidase [Acidobacteriota bacterium]